MKELHKGYHGIERIKALARSYVYWPYMDKKIKRYVQNCNNCASAAKSLPKDKLCTWPITKCPMERIHIDIAAPYHPQSNGQMGQPHQMKMFKHF